jgi:hypothetical protein
MPELFMPIFVNRKTHYEEDIINYFSNYDICFSRFTKSAFSSHKR